MRKVLREIVPPAEACLICIVTLHIPAWSLLSIAALGALGLVRWIWHRAIGLQFGIRLLLLLCFVGSYHAISASNSSEPADTALRHVALAVVMYSLGHAASFDSFRAQMWKLLGLAGGFVVTAFLAVREALESARTGDLAIASRAASSVFAREEIMNGPVLGAFASLGMCLLPVAFCARPKEPGAEVTTWRLLAAALAGLGLYSNLALQNRTPAVAMAAAIVVAVIVLPWVYPAFRTGRAVALLGLPVLLGLALNLGAVADFLASQYGVVWRFKDSGLRTERYQAWMAVLEGVARHPWGGRAIYLGGLRYAHNLWLDVVVEAGVLPLILLLAFHLSHVSCVRWVLRSRLPAMLIVALVGLGISFFTTFLVEPGMSMSIFFFPSSCYLLGLIAGMPSGPAAPDESAA